MEREYLIRYKRPDDITGFHEQFIEDPDEAYKTFDHLRKRGIYHVKMFRLAKLNECEASDTNAYPKIKG